MTAFLQFRESSLRNRAVPVPLPPRGVLLNPQVKMRQHPCRGGRFTYNSKYRRHTSSVTISHSPITLVNLSSINHVSIFRRSCPPLNPVYVRCQWNYLCAFYCYKITDDRETDRFFSASGVQLPQPTSGLFHFRRSAFSSQLKTKEVNILVKVAVLPSVYQLKYWWGSYIF